MAAQKQRKQTPDLEFNFGFEYNIPGGWHTNLQDEAYRLLTETLLPYMEQCFQVSNSFLVGKDTKLVRFTLVRKDGNIEWSKKSQKPLKIGADPATSVDFFKVYLLRRKPDSCFEVNVRVLQGGHEAALKIRNILAQEGFVSPEAQLPVETPKSEGPIIAFPATYYTPVVPEEVPQVITLTNPEPTTVMASEPEPEVQSPPAIIEGHETGEDDIHLFLLEVKDKANLGKGFSLPITDKEMRMLRSEFVKTYPQCIGFSSGTGSHTKGWGAAIARFSKKMLDDGWLQHRAGDLAWFLTDKAAAEIGVENFASIDPKKVKHSVPARASKETVKSPDVPLKPTTFVQLPRPAPPALLNLVLEPILSEEAIDRNISELKAEMLSNEEKISQLQQRNSTVIPKELEKLKDQKQVWVERRNKRQAEDLLRRLEEQAALVRASLEKPGEITDADFQQWKKDFEG